MKGPHFPWLFKLVHRGKVIAYIVDHIEAQGTPSGGKRRKLQS
jgi:hypothetical protein